MERANLKAIPQVAHLRAGALVEFGRILDERAAERLLFVVDETAYAASGAAAELENVFASRQVQRFAGFELNPKLHDILRGIEQFRELHPDLIVALGGGTAVDLGKLIGTLAVQQDDAREIITGQRSIQHDGPPLIAIPTTAGTGSEATHFAVAYVDGKKYSVAEPNLLPDYAIIDPELTGCLPQGITAATGLDAFCQAVESIWSVGATEQSIRFADEAARLAWEHLRQAVSSPTLASREGMCRAAHLSGKAINISKTTAPHAMSYAITTDYGVPHGMAVALTLGPMLVYNSQVTASDCMDPRGPTHVADRIAQILDILQAKDVMTASDNVRELIVAIGCPTSLSEVGVTDDAALERLVRHVDAKRLSNNPRQASPRALFALLQNNL